MGGTAAHRPAEAAGHMPAGRGAEAAGRTPEEHHTVAAVVVHTVAAGEAARRKPGPAGAGDTRRIVPVAVRAEERRTVRVEAREAVLHTAIGLVHRTAAAGMERRMAAAGAHRRAGLQVVVRNPEGEVADSTLAAAAGRRRAVAAGPAGAEVAADRHNPLAAEVAGRMAGILGKTLSQRWPWVVQSFSCLLLSLLLERERKGLRVTRKFAT